MLEEVHRYEGTVNQFLGDGIMALFGAPIAHEDHAQRALHAALGIRKALEGYHEELQRRRGLTFRNRPHDAPWSRDRYEGLCRYDPSLFTGALAALHRSEALRAARYLEDSHFIRPLVGTGLALAGLSWLRRRKQEVPARTRCTEES